MGTLTIYRSDHKRVMDDARMRRLYLALVHYTNGQGVYTGWTPDGRLTLYGPEDTVERVREFLR